MKHEQMEFDFYGGIVRVVRNYWDNVYHVTTMDKRRIVRDDKPAYFAYREDAERWAHDHGFKILGLEHSKRRY